MTFWPFYPRKFGARGDGTTDDGAALASCYTAAKNAVEGGETAAVYYEPGANYGVTAPLTVSDQSAVHVHGRGAMLTGLTSFSDASGYKGIAWIDHESGSSTNNKGMIEDLIIDINGETAYGLSNDWSSATADHVLKKSWLLRNIEIRNNIAGKHCFYIRNPENGIKIENPTVDGFASTVGSPTAAIYIIDKGTGANHGNIYVKSPFVATNASNTVNGRAIEIRGEAVNINRCYIGGPGAHLFNWSSGGTSIGNYAVFISGTKTGETHPNRTYVISDINMEDWKYAIHAEHGASSTIDNLLVHHVSMEYKNPGAESGVTLIDLASSSITALIDGCYAETNAENCTAVNCDSDEEVWVNNLRTQEKGATNPWGTNDSLKFQGSALNNNPITFHLGKWHEWGGSTNTFSGATDRYPSIYGTSSTGASASATEANERTTAKGYFALRQLVIKPNTNSLTNNATIGFRINGATVLSGTITAGSTSEVVITTAVDEFIEIEPADTINWFLDVNAAEGGSIKFASLRAIADNLQTGAE